MSIPSPGRRDSRRRVAQLIAALALMATTAADAQVNIERLRRNTDRTGLLGTARVDLTARTGNVRLVLLNVEGRADLVRRDWTAFLIGTSDVGWQGGRRFSNTALVHLRATALTTHPVGIEAFGQVDYDKARRLDFRSVIGGGARFAIASGSGGRMVAGTGLMVEHERLELPDTAAHARQTDALRSTSYLTFQLQRSERISIAGTGYAQPKLDEPGDIRILADTRLAVQLVGGVSLTVTGKLRFDSRPPDDIAELDTTLTTGLALEW
ncbi:MAG: DUF481 domain-containing protein [Gemmatimonadales bacterium]